MRGLPEWRMRHSAQRCMHRWVLTQRVRGPAAPRRQSLRSFPRRPPATVLAAAGDWVQPVPFYVSAYLLTASQLSPEWYRGMCFLD